MPALLMACAVFAEGPPPWTDEPQTYCMVPVLPETAERLGVTVNGVWGGIGSTHPLLTGEEMVPAVRKRYKDDVAAFVRDSRDAGLIVTGVVNGLEGFPPLFEKWPELESMVCRKADGAPAETDEMRLMCTNNPRWLQWEIDFGHRAIDDGADVILVDTPMSSSFIAGFLGGGFCSHCLGRFRTHLFDTYEGSELEARFGIKDHNLEGLAARLRPFQFIGGDERNAFVETSPDAMLYREFIRCQEQASFETRKALVDNLRAYAAEKGRHVAFTTNAADLSTANPRGHWIRGLMFADLFDYFTYEQNLMPDGLPFGDATRLPRGKWAAYHRLAFAIHHRRSPAVLHASQMGGLLMGIMGKKASYNAWTAAQSAEAYAADGASVQFYIEPEPGMDLFIKQCWQGAGDHARFVLDHEDLYSEHGYSGASTAIVFLYNERGRTTPSVFPSYYGLAQAFTEGNYPFDVLFGGDGHYVEDRLTAEMLRRYNLLFVPSPIDPTENQRTLLQEAARRGATVVCMEPERLGLAGETDEGDTPDGLRQSFPFGEGRVHVLAGTITSTEMVDVATTFFRTYAPEQRATVLRMAEWLGMRAILPRCQDGLVCAFPVQQRTHRRTIIHLVNYDIDYEHDTVRGKESIALRIPIALHLAGGLTVTLLAPDTDAPLELPFTTSDGDLHCTVPQLGAWASVVIAEATR